MINPKREISLKSMRSHLIMAKGAMSEFGEFGYEVFDSINELISFAEFELDELDIEYE